MAFEDLNGWCEVNDALWFDNGVQTILELTHGNEKIYEMVFKNQNSQVPLKNIEFEKIDGEWNRFCFIFLRLQLP